MEVGLGPVAGEDEGEDEGEGEGEGEGVGSTTTGAGDMTSKTGNGLGD